MKNNIIKKSDIRKLVRQSLHEQRIRNNNDVLEEGMWDNIKYGLSKLGRYKADGSIFGKKSIDRVYKEKIQNIVDKKGNELIKVLDSKIKETNPKFPNNKEQSEFLETVLGIAAVYDSIVGATEKDIKDKEYMPVDVANGIINDLREYVRKFLDVDLAAVYTAFDENVDMEDEPIEEDDAEDVRSKLGAKRKAQGGKDFESQRMKTLKSGKLSNALALVGGSLAGLGWISQTEWFKTLFEEIITIPSMELVKETLTDETSFIANIKPGEGMTQILNRMMNVRLNINSSPQDFLDVVKEIGGGDLQKGIDALSEQDGIFKKPEAARQALQQLAEDPDGYGNTLGEVFKEKWAGTGRSVGDVFVTRTGGELQALLVNKLTTIIPKIVFKQVTQTSAAYAIAKGLGAALPYVGIAAIAAGATVALLRKKGQKSSRAATLNALYQSIRNLEGGAGIIEPEGDAKPKSGGKVGAATTDNLFINLTSLFKYIVNNRNVLSTGSSSSGASGNEYNLFTLKNGKKIVGRIASRTGNKSNNNETLTIITDKGKEVKISSANISKTQQANAGYSFFNRDEPKKPATKKTTNKKTNTSGGIEYNIGGDKSRPNPETTTLAEGYKYFKDKKLSKFLEKDFAFDKLEKFDKLLSMVELVRNIVRKLKGRTGDENLEKFLVILDKNPIMLTDFSKLMSINVNDPKQANGMKSFIKQVLSTLYSSEYKFGSMVDKIGKLGGGNINKVLEEASYSASDENPSKAFLKDAQSLSAFKNNLVNFLKVLMGMYQYLHAQKNKPKQQDKKQQKQNKPEQKQQDDLNESMLKADLQKMIRLF